MEKIKISSDLEKIEKSKKDFEIIDTNNPKIKILIINRSKKPIIVAVSDDIENETKDTEKYFYKDEFSKLLELDGKKYKVISMISNEGYTDGKYYTDEHISMETIDEFRGFGIASEMFRIKNLIDNTLSKTSESFVSNINLLLKNGYRVVGKLDKKTGKILESNAHEFVKKIVELKISKGNFIDRLSDTYIFEKKS